MKKIWHYLKNHVSHDFRISHYAIVGFFLLAAISFNYSVDFEDDYLENLNGVSKFSGYFLMYAVLYFLTAVSYAFCYKDHNFLQNAKFWFFSIFGLSVLSLDSSVPFLEPIIGDLVAPGIHFWMFKVSINAISFFTVFLPILFFYFFFERNERSVYGLQPKGFDAKPYFLMLLIMLPLLIAASFHDSFLRQYPMYKITSAHLHLGVPEWVTVAIYELAYGLDFITVELLFRGFFVLAMATFLKRGAVLAMAVIYCSLHFGKPMGEAISSIFGGYVLGVIAYETRSVWGGIIVHMGIAWLMELIAFIQK
jgi:hypothetical protein